MKKENVMDPAKVQDLPVDEIADSPFNPRKTFDKAKMEELAASIRARGVDTPIKVRPAPEDHGGFELVYGARRLLGSKMAGRATIPGFVVEMTDAEVREAQLVENGQREDVHPLEEADAFEAAMRLDKLSAKDIGDKIGKSEGYVYGRLKLAKLCPAAREAYLAGKLTASTALIIARIPNEKLQAEATKELTPSYRTEPVSAREASSLVQRSFMLRLADAPFDRADASLVLTAGACAACPKRTGAQRELFSDIDDKQDLCIDPPCWRGKVDARWKREVAAAKASGRPVITDSAEAKKLFPYGNSLGGAEGGKYVEFNRTCYEDPKSRTYAQLLKKAKPVTTLVRDPQGGIHELLPKKGLEKLLKEAGHDLKKERAEGGHSGETAKQKEKRKAEAAARELREKVTEAAAVKMAGIVEKGLWKTAEPWRVLAKRLADGMYGGGALERRKVGQKKGDLEKYLAGLNVGELAGLVFELAIGSYSTWNDYDEDLVADARTLGVDLKQLERELAPKPEPAAPAQSSAPAKGKGAKAAAPAKAPAKKGGKK